MQVANVMNNAVRSCHVEDHLDLAAREMWDGDIGSVPIVDADRKVVGIVTDRDICMAAYMQGRPLGEIPVTVAMAKKVVTCRPDDLVADAEARMQTNQIRRLPVVDGNGRLTGILSINDLARRAGADRSKATRAVGTEEVAVTLAAISQPHGKVATPVMATPAAKAIPAPAPAPASGPAKGKTRGKSGAQGA